MAKQRGRGLAAIEYPTGMNQGGDPSQCWVKLKPDGRVDVLSGTVDLGQGAKTIQTQIVAEVLGVPTDWVTFDNSNTDTSPLCTGSFASRATFMGGNAARVAAERARERVLDIASRLLEVDAADLDIDEGEVFVKGATEKRVGVPDVAAAATWQFGELITGTGAYLKPYANVDPETGRTDRNPHAGISYGACVADVEVDDETGAVAVTKLIQVYDVGRAINPMFVEGQLEGGGIMGLSFGLLESSYPYYPSVEHRGSEFGSYLSASIEGLPDVETVLLENPDVDGPFGAKGVGEMASNGIGPAIVAAIHDAIGIWVTESPITPERVLRALDEKAAGGGEPRRDGKRYVFDEELSVNTLATGISFEVNA